MQTRVPGQQQMVIIGGQGQQGQQGQQQATRQQIAVPQNLITTNNANAARIIRPTQQQPQQTLQQTGMVRQELSDIFLYKVVVMETRKSVLVSSWY